VLDPTPKYQNSYWGVGPEVVQVALPVMTIGFVPDVDGGAGAAVTVTVEHE
jgi:hypothetical protein